MKKLISVSIVLILLLTCFSSCDLDSIKDMGKGNLKITYRISDGKAVVTEVPDNLTMPEIVIPDEYEGNPVTEIADFAIVNLENVTKVTIGKNVEAIGLWAMENNKKLTAIEVDEENQYFCDIDGVLFSKDKKTLLFYPMARGIEEINTPDGKTVKGISYDIPEGVEAIRTKAFYKCSDVRKITLPETLKAIEEKAFFRCSFDEILLPEALTFIGKDAFSYCTELKTIYVPENVTEIGEYAFYNCTNLLEINIGSSEDELTLGKKWYPTNNGLDIKELTITYRNDNL